MRSSNPRLLAGLSVSAVVAAVALGAATVASQAAQAFRPNFSVGPRAPTVNVNPSFRSEPRFQRFNDNAPDRIVVKGRGGKGKGTDVSTNDGGDGRYPGRRPPKGKRPPGLGPIVGTGVIIGTGVAIGTLGPTGPAGANTLPSSGGPAAQRINIPPPGETRFVKDHLVLEFAANEPGIAQLLRRHGLILLSQTTFTLTNSMFVQVRIANRRPVGVALQGLRNEVALLSGQPDYLYRSSQDQRAAQPEPPKVTPAVATAAAIPAGGDPAQYALAKLRIGEAHTIANGERVLVAVIDSGIDYSHPELAGAIVGAFDALGKAEKPHMHGTAIAGAIAAHSKLMGAAPAAKILAIRAFGAEGTSAEATTMAVMNSIEFASVNKARVINMSFAGPADPGVARQLAAAKANGAVLIAASGNFGPKSPPQYPAADPNVIAVSATDSNDRMFRASNIGPHISVAAPGVDILLPAPNSDYRIISGTSFSAAYVSGVAALMIQRAPGLTPDSLRQILESTAKDLGPAGKDPEFGAGLVDAYGAIMALPVSATASAAPEEISAQQAKQ